MAVAYRVEYFANPNNPSQPIPRSVPYDTNTGQHVKPKIVQPSRNAQGQTAMDVQIQKNFTSHNFSTPSGPKNVTPEGNVKNTTPKVNVTPSNYSPYKVSSPISAGPAPAASYVPNVTSVQSGGPATAFQGPRPDISTRQAVEAHYQDVMASKSISEKNIRESTITNKPSFFARALNYPAYYPGPTNTGLGSTISFDTSNFALSSLKLGAMVELPASLAQEAFIYGGGLYKSVIGRRLATDTYFDISKLESGRLPMVSSIKEQFGKIETNRLVSGEVPLYNVGPSSLETAGPFTRRVSIGVGGSASQAGLQDSGLYLSVGEASPLRIINNNKGYSPFGVPGFRRDTLNIVYSKEFSGQTRESLITPGFSTARALEASNPNVAFVPKRSYLGTGEIKPQYFTDIAGVRRLEAGSNENQVILGEGSVLVPRNNYFSDLFRPKYLKFNGRFIDVNEFSVGSVVSSDIKGIRGSSGLSDIFGGVGRDYSYELSSKGRSVFRSPGFGVDYYSGSSRSDVSVRSMSNAVSSVGSSLLDSSMSGFGGSYSKSPFKSVSASSKATSSSKSYYSGSSMSGFGGSYSKSPFKSVSASYFDNYFSSKSYYSGSSMSSKAPNTFQFPKESSFKFDNAKLNIFKRTKKGKGRQKYELLPSFAVAYGGLKGTPLKQLEGKQLIGLGLRGF